VGEIQRWDHDGQAGVFMLRTEGGRFVRYDDHVAAVAEAVTNALAHGLVEGAMVERERIRQAVEGLPATKSEDHDNGWLRWDAVIAAIKAVGHQHDYDDAYLCRICGHDKTEMGG
jgi:hypothetical protein